MKHDDNIEALWLKISDGVDNAMTHKGIEKALRNFIKAGYRGLVLKIQPSIQLSEIDSADALRIAERKTFYRCIRIIIDPD